MPEFLKFSSYQRRRAGIQPVMVSFFLLVGWLCQGQQDPQYTQYMYNQSVFNPAYAGTTENISIGALYRNQWTGLDGAPETLTFFGHSPIGDNLGVGISLIADKIGPAKETSAFADVSYRVLLGPELTLSFGLKAGASFLDVNLTDLVLEDPGDPLFDQNISTTNLNIGSGLFLYSEKFYVGLSAPNFLKYTYLQQDNFSVGADEIHYFITSGYVFDLNESWKVKPSFLVKSAFNAPISFDVNINFLLYEKLDLGASYRYEDSISALINFRVLPSLRIGYAYDAVTSDIKTAASASHEVFVLWDINLSTRISRSPRFF